MPIFEFICLSCSTSFEELCENGKTALLCPECGSSKIEKIISVPSPLKKGAFPFKPGAPSPAAAWKANGCSACKSGS